MTVKDVIRYRKIWMGIAMLWIMLYHSGISTDFILLKYIKNIGYGGVDIFLFASGIGNYYSYLRDESPLQFLKRRVLRLAPTYVPFILLWCAFEIIIGKLSPINIIGNIFGIQALSHSGLSFNWYLAGLLIAYVLTPYLAAFIKNHNIGKNIVLIAVLVLISTAFWNDKKLIIIFSRLPIYAAGMLFSKYDFKVIKKKYLLLGGFLFVLGNILLYIAIDRFESYLKIYGLYWYPFIIITPFLCTAISYVSYYAEKTKVFSALLKVISLVGTYSFELYLTHIFIFENYESIMQRLNINITVNNLFRIGLLITAFLSAWLLSLVSKQISKKIKSKT